MYLTAWYVIFLDFNNSQKTKLVLSVFWTSAPTRKFVYARYGLQTVCSVDAMFILVRAERPYIQSLMASYRHLCCLMLVVGVRSEREREERLSSLLCVGGPKTTELESYAKPLLRPPDLQVSPCAWSPSIECLLSRAFLGPSPVFVVDLLLL
jgi:hypothetical protein